ncbi:hypothetical protein scyTo_0011500 [Scyliorhinus torazame]|uniref:Uncharacterized protein n=1 Tax=Scyliorhinus torazame TaxID=75743 RepID=A0A401NP39_SCYTO|nr:hypothetical protein [Scyliorhinus torazame]
MVKGLLFLLGLLVLVLPITSYSLELILPGSSFTCNKAEGSCTNIPCDSVHPPIKDSCKIGHCCKVPGNKNIPE